MCDHEVRWVQLLLECVESQSVSISKRQPTVTRDFESRIYIETGYIFDVYLYSGSFNFHKSPNVMGKKSTM